MQYDNPLYALAVSSSGLSGKGPDVAEKPSTAGAAGAAAAVVVVGADTGAVTGAGAVVG